MSDFDHYPDLSSLTNCDVFWGSAGESIPIRLFLAGYEMTPTMRDINKKFSVRYYLNLVLIDEEERRYFKQQVTPCFSFWWFSHFVDCCFSF